MRYLIALLYFFSTTTASALTEVDKTNIFSKNVLKNGGFENGKAQWTASAGTFAVTTSSPMLGTMHATWDAAASGNTLTSTAVAIPAGMYGRNAVASCLITTASGTATHEIQAYDGSTVLSEVSVTSSTTPARTSANFIMPSSGNIQLRIYANADEPSIAIDDCYVGPAEGFNVSDISQVQFIGSAYYSPTASCTGWTRTNTALGAFASDADCPAPTVEFNPGPGTISTTDADLPQFTVNNLPAGRYAVEIQGYAVAVSSIGGLAINDGTTTSGTAAAYLVSAGAHATTIKGHFIYTTAGNRTFSLYGSSSSGAIIIENDGSNKHLRFNIYRYPTSNEQAYTPDVAAWKIDANISGADITLGTAAQTAYVTPNNASLTLTQNSGSASVGISCSSTNDNTVGSTTCSAGSEEPGIVFNLPRDGTVRACFSFAHQIVTAASGVVNTTFQVVQTANGSQTVGVEGKARVQSGFNTASSTITMPHRVCGELPLSSGKNTVRLMYEQAVTATVTSSNIFADAGANNGQRDVHVTVEYIDQQFPAPVIVNSVVSKYSGIIGDEHAEINCDASSSVTQNPGSWISAIGNRSTASCALTIAGGVFSATPYSCQVTTKATTVQATACSCSSATACTVYGASADYDAYVTITGPR